MSRTTIVAYYRVSTLEQGDNHSLPFQQREIRAVCERYGWDIAEEFTDTYSAKNFNRPGWKALMKYCKAYKKDIKYVVVKTIDRFGRNTLASLETLQELVGLDIGLYSLDEGAAPTEGNTTPIFHYMRIMKLANAEIENANKAVRVKEAIRDLNREGYYCSTAPMGYVNHKLGTKPSLKPGEKAEHIRRAFELAAEGWSNEDVRRHLLKNNVYVAHGQMKYLLQNPVYMGKIRTIDKTDPKKVEIYQGKHEPIVSESLFKAVQYRLAGKNVPKHFVHLASEFYLKGLVVCKCGDLVTASKSTSRNGSKITYYHSKSQCGCKERLSETALNESILQTLNRLDMPEWVVNASYDILRHELENGEKTDKEELMKLQQEKLAIEKRVAKLQQDYYNGMGFQLFERLDNQLSAELHAINERLKVTQVNEKDNLELMRKPALWLCNLRSLYSDGSPQVKRKIVGSIFKEPIMISGKRSSNHQFIDFIEQLCSISAGFRGVKKIGTPVLTRVPIRYPRSEGFSNQSDLRKIYELGEFLKRTA